MACYKGLAKADFWPLDYFLRRFLNDGYDVQNKAAANQLWRCLLEKARTHFQENPDDNFW